ncbi:MAG: hypothetical protein LAT67_14505 [Balneolales bacterium]|nr:hypothetical protein [Balneolales bacterium]
MAPKEKKIVWFGMKVSPEEKGKIKEIAEHYNITQKEAVMNLVEDRVADINLQRSAVKKANLAQFAGLYEGEATLSTDKSHLSDYGRSSLD